MASGSQPMAQPIVSFRGDYFVKVVGVSGGTEDMLLVKFMLIEQNGRPLSGEEDLTSDNILVEREFTFPVADLDLQWPRIFYSEQNLLSDDLTYYLFCMGVPDHRQTKIIDAVYKLAAAAVGGGLAILVGIGDAILLPVNGDRDACVKSIVSRSTKEFPGSIFIDESFFIDQLKAVEAKYSLPNIDYSFIFRAPAPPPPPPSE